MDPADRLWWRSKEVLDTAYVLELGLQAAPYAPYCLLLQDDIGVTPGFLKELDTFLTKMEGESRAPDVMSLFSLGGNSSPRKVAVGSVHFGFVAVVFKTKIIPAFLHYIRSNFSGAPIDWQLNAYITTNNLSLWMFEPNLVEHTGVQSSLVGKKQSIKSTTFSNFSCLF